MDFQLGGRSLPAPLHIEITSKRTAFEFVVTWDKVLNPDANVIPQQGQVVITSVAYNVYRGTTGNGIFYRLNTQPITDTRYETQVANRNPNNNYFYKVSAVALYNDGSQVEGRLSNPVAFHIPNTNKWFNKINERNMWILRNTGVLMDLYRRKTEGTRCSCYNEAYGRGEYACPICFGTTWEGGYEPVYQIWVREKPTAEQMDLTDQGLVINRQTGAWTISKTLIKNFDILINPQGLIYSVLNSNVNSSAGYYFHQELNMKEVDPTDVLYNLSRDTLYPEF